MDKLQATLGVITQVPNCALEICYRTRGHNISLKETERALLQLVKEGKIAATHRNKAAGPTYYLPIGERKMMEQ